MFTSLQLANLGAGKATISRLDSMTRAAVIATFGPWVPAIGRKERHA
ncbi:MAG: hypothetical protein QOD06_1118 [Candidatus Binatota bacterium]|jgi:hypothetical protein|nr:hypothetical protein [Candidatus Binatota bacterium]